MKKLKTEEFQIKVLFGIMIAVLAAVLIPLFVIGHFNFMSVDDYGYAQEPERLWEQTHSVLRVLWAQIEYTWNYYHTWQGTYFYEWLTTSLLGLLGKNYYFVGTYLNLGGFALAEFFSLSVIFRKGLGADKFRAGIVAASVLCLQVLLTPVPVEAYYWFCGATLYTFILALVWVLIALWVCLYYCDKAQKKKLVAYNIRIVLLSIAIGGGNYVTGLALTLIYVFYVAWMYWRKHPLKVLMTCNAVIYILAFGLNVMAPGNTKRQTASGVTGTTAIGSIIASLKEGVEYVTVNFIPPCVILGLLLAPIFWHIVKKRNYKYSWPLLVSLISFGVFAAQFTPTLYVLNMTGAGRIQNLYRFNYYIWLYGNELYWIGWIWKRWSERAGAGALNGQAASCKGSYLLPAWTVGGMLLCLSLYFWGGDTVTTRSAIEALRSGGAQQYYADYQERLKILEDESITEAYVEPFSVKPYLLYFGDIEKDTDDWVNYTVAQYFRKEKVGLLPAEEQ